MLLHSVQKGSQSSLGRTWNGRGRGALGPDGLFSSPKPPSKEQIANTPPMKHPIVVPLLIMRSSILWVGLGAVATGLDSGSQPSGIDRFPFNSQHFIPTSLIPTERFGPTCFWATSKPGWLPWPSRGPRLLRQDDGGDGGREGGQTCQTPAEDGSGGNRGSGCREEHPLFSGKNLVCQRVLGWRFLLLLGVWDGLEGSRKTETWGGECLEVPSFLEVALQGSEEQTLLGDKALAC